MAVGDGEREISSPHGVDAFDDPLSTAERVPDRSDDEPLSHHGTPDPQGSSVTLLREPSGRVSLSLSFRGGGRVIPIERRMLRNFARLCSGMEREVSAWVPALLVLVLDPESPARDRLAAFLTDLLLGGDHSRALPHVTYLSMTTNLPELLAVFTYREALWCLLDDPNASLRAAAAQLLALPYQGVHGHRRFAARLQVETDDVVRASLVMATAVSGWMLAPHERASAELEPWLSASHPLVQVATAAALVILEGSQAPLEAVHLLGAAIDAPPAHEPAWPWAHGDVRSLARRTLPAADLR